MGLETRLGQRADSMKALLAEGYDAIFVGSGAPPGRDLDVPGRREGAANIHIGIDWLSSVSFGHVTKIGRRAPASGVCNNTTDCCPAAARLGAQGPPVRGSQCFAEAQGAPCREQDAMH